MIPLTESEVAARSERVFRRILETLPSCQEKHVESGFMNGMSSRLMNALGKMIALIDSIIDDPNLEADKDQGRAAKISCATSGGSELNVPKTTEIQHLEQTRCRLSRIIERLKRDPISTMLSALDEQAQASIGDRELPDRTSSSILIDEFVVVLEFTVKVLAGRRQTCLVYADCWQVFSNYENVRTKLDLLFEALGNASHLLRDRRPRRVPVFMEALPVPSNEMPEHS